MLWNRISLIWFGPGSDMWVYVWVVLGEVESSDGGRICGIGRR